ncbi:MAG: HNH endonuclease signature motif containing protein, partial [Candidatus Peregrinibacteria bacterium]
SPMKNLTDKQLYSLCQRYGKNARIWKRKFIALLPEVEKRKLHRQKGFYSIFEFAAKLGGVGKKTVMEVLRVHQKVEDKPLLKEQIEKQGFAKVRAIVPLIENTEEKDLVNMIESMPRRALEKTVQELKKDEPSSFPTGWNRSTITISFQIDEETDLKLRSFKQKLEKQRKQKVPFNEVLKALLEKEEIPTKKCQFPACNKPTEEIHHKNRYALTKKHENLVPLCKTHHQIAHSGLIPNENTWEISKTPNTTGPKLKVDRKFQKHTLKL